MSPRMARALLLVAAGVAIASLPASPTVVRATLTNVGDTVSELVIPEGESTDDERYDAAPAESEGHVHAAFAALRSAPTVTVPISPVCDGLDALPLGLCTHGPDHAPAAAANGNSPGDAVAQRSIGCIGSGADGQRVEVLYVRGPGRPAASSSRVASIRRWVEQVEWTVQASAERLGGERRVRWRTDSRCDAVVSSVAVSSAALTDFSRTISELADRGYDRRDRSYMLFVESTRYCGIATAPRDDSGTNNVSTRSAGYARVDTPCWSAGDKGYHSIAAHELMHTLGAVQRSAPHGTSRGHCSDEQDLLCYDDGAGTTMQVVCRDGDGSTSGAGDANDRLLDCRGDDYFHPSPRSGSYLAKHWNTADHPRLHDPSAPPPKPKPTLLGNPVGYVLGLGSH